MKQITVITARHTLDGMMYTWKISKSQLVELTMALTTHSNFILAAETRYGSKLVEYVDTRLEDAEIAKNYKKVQAILVGYNRSKIEGFYEEEEESFKEESLEEDFDLE